MNRKYILYVLLSFLLISCSGMNDIIQEYLDRGEINYIGKTDSIYAIGGKNRITFKWIVNTDPRIEKMSIAWQNGDKLDTLTCDVDRSAADEGGYVSQTFEMPGVEGTFAFYAFHSGSQGYNSVSTEVTGTLYGERYADKLKARRVDKIEVFVDKTQIAWQISEGSVQDELVYTGTDDRQHSVLVKPLDMMTELPDFKLGTDIKVRSLYVPETETVIQNGEKVEVWEKENEFYVEREVETPRVMNLWEETWEVVDFSSEEPTGEQPNGAAARIIDNNLATFWHSAYSTGNAPLPHHMTIDMKFVRRVKEVMIAKRQGNTDLKKAHVEVSIDGADWTPLTGDFEYPKAAEPNAQTVTYNEAVRARYVKVVITESHRNPFVSVSEVRVYGMPE